ncbi:MAG: hypothetical protein ACMXYF_03935 [Candidatus Woesearchaeota archaeon]
MVTWLLYLIGALLLFFLFVRVVKFLIKVVVIVVLLLLLVYIGVGLFGPPLYVFEDTRAIAYMDGNFTPVNLTQSQLEAINGSSIRQWFAFQEYGPVFSLNQTLCENCSIEQLLQNSTITKIKDGFLQRWHQD